MVIHWVWMSEKKFKSNQIKKKTTKLDLPDFGIGQAVKKKKNKIVSINNQKKQW